MELEPFIVERTTWKIVAAVTKWEILAATKVKMSGSKKKRKRKKNTYDIPSIKRVTRKFYVTKQRQRNVQKKGAARAKMCFC